MVNLLLCIEMQKTLLWLRVYAKGIYYKSQIKRRSMRQAQYENKQEGIYGNLQVNNYWFG